MSVRNRIQQANQARHILNDWLGEGGQPVTLEDAQRRADICTKGCDGEMCPCNDADPSWTWNLVSQFYISRQMALKETMKLHLKDEDKLHTCSKCGCVLRLKVWTPFQHIFRHMSDQQFDQFPDWCWLKIERGKKAL